jgi:hypothetical protein
MQNTAFLAKENHPCCSSGDGKNNTMKKINPKSNFFLPACQVPSID